MSREEKVEKVQRGRSTGLKCQEDGGQAELVVMESPSMECGRHADEAGRCSGETGLGHARDPPAEEVCWAESLKQKMHFEGCLQFWPQRCSGEQFKVLAESQT